MSFVQLHREIIQKLYNKTVFFHRAFYNAGNGCLTYWSPNINIYRDPRWGRGHETPGEDPYLNKIYALLYVKAMQGENGGFMKTSACCKHFSAHSLENDRHSFDAIVNRK